MTKLILIRHGETEWNATGRIQGHKPVSLNDRGHQQAQAVALRLQHEPFDALYSSDLKRTLQTAQAIANLTHHTIHTDVRLREWDLGVLAGLTRPEAESQHPEAYAIYNRQIVEDAIPNGESIRNRYTRVTTCLEEHAHNHPNQTLVIITHGGPLGDCYRRATHLSFEKPLTAKLYNAGINIITIDHSDWTLETWGDIDHLKNIGSMDNWEGRK